MKATRRRKQQPKTMSTPNNSETSEHPPVRSSDVFGGALRLIKRSSSVDFENPVQWGQWCRTVAIAALAEDLEKLEWLESEIDPPPNKHSATSVV